jgi:hypothetical protein
MSNLISVGQIIDQTWERYRTEFKQMTSVSGWLLAPCLISLIALILYPEASAMLAGESQTWYETGSIFLWSFNNSIIAPVVGLWVFIMLVVLLSFDFKGEKINLKKIATKAWRLFLPMVLINILIGLILISAWFLTIPGFALNFLGVAINNGFLAGFGSLLLIVGLVAALFYCVRWIVDFYFASFVLITEEKKGRLALIRSKTLSIGRRPAIMFRILLPKLVFIIILVAIQSVLGYLLSYFINFFAGLNSDIIAKANTVSDTLIVSVVSILGTPILVLADYIIFDNLRQTLKK